MKKLMACVALAMLAACADHPVSDDAQLNLAPDEGIAAVVLDAPDRITQVEFVPDFSGGDKFEVPDSEGGQAVFLLPVKAGRYCLYHLKYKGRRRDSHLHTCFEVMPGHISYSGHIGPEHRAIGDDGKAVLFMTRNYRYDQYTQLMQSNYPRLSAAFPQAAPAPLPAGATAPPPDAELGLYSVHNDDGSNTLFVQNHASWPVTLTHLKLFDCVNLSQACDDLQLGLVLQPYQTQQVMVLSAAQKGQPFSYRYEQWHQSTE